MSGSNSRPLIASSSSAQQDPKAARCSLPTRSSAAPSPAIVRSSCRGAHRRSGCLGELLGLGNGLFDRANHIEGLLRQVVELALAQALEALDGFGEADEL